VNEEASFTPKPGRIERIRGRSGQSLEVGSATGCPLCVQVFNSLDERARRILFHERSQGLVYEILWTERIRKFTMIMIWFDLDENPEYRVSRHFDLSTDIVSVRECKTEYR
jgi:hypothetical protein